MQSFEKGMVVNGKEQGIFYGYAGIAGDEPAAEAAEADAPPPASQTIDFERKITAIKMHFGEAGQSVLPPPELCEGRG